MARVLHTFTLDPGALDEVLQPRDDVVAEVAAGRHRFTAAGGPFDHYLRTVATAPAADGRVAVTETIEFRLAVPFWGALFVLPYRHALRRWPRPAAAPWWAPPDRIDARAASVLGLLCSVSIIGGYLGTLITQTITFAADEFEAGTSAQGATLAAVRVGVLLALAVVAVADRRGRRPLLLLAAGAGCVITATGALAPNLVWLGVSQTAARGMATALGLLITIVAAEEMPKGSRAYAVSLLAMTAALGAGMAVWALPLADLGTEAWRILYVIPLLGLPLVVAVGRHLPETERFAASHVEAPVAGHGARFWLLAASAFLGALFVAPAAQFLNEFLRDERGFSAARISLFTIATNTPGGIGIVVGGRLADVRGRRLVGAVGMGGGALLTAAMYLSDGWSLWAWSVAGAVVGAATVPALGVYGPELFPTSLRGRANGVIALVGVVGSMVGLVGAGVLSDRLDGFGPTMAVLAIAPLLLAVLILVAYPETAARRLEDLNPEDAPFARPDGDGGRL